jgi:ATP-dependent helicase HepA
VGELLHDRLAKLLAERSPDIAQVNAFIEETATLRAELSLRLSSGRDRLLELSSFRPKEAHRLLEEIARTDREELAAKVMGPLFKHYGVGVEEADNDKWKLTTDCVSDHRFPLPKQENPLITFSRKTALAREDIEFVSGDHPMVLNSLDLFLSSECGAGAFALWPDKNNKALFLECIYVLECIAPDGLYVNRFLPPTPLRIIIDHAKKEVTQSHPPHLFDAALITGKPDMLLSKKKITGELLPLMLATAEASANNASGPLIEQALNTMRELLNGELARLTDLRQINSAVSIEEIHECEREKEALEKHLKEARVRLDAVRVVWRG